MIMCIQNLVKFCPSILKVLSKNQFLTSFKGRNSAALGRIWPKFELVRALMHVTITCKYKKEWMKNSREKVEDTVFSHGNLWSDLAECRTHPSSHACYHYLQVWKGFDQEQPRKSGDMVFPIISLWGFFQTVQGQLTPQSVVRAGQNSNSSKLSCMLSLPASMKRIGWKTAWEKVETPFSPL